ncbi:MAG: alpha/beta hydrolase fold domain-containing protein [Planctomycetes bacterium]|nr:alpha/beta hydrolase fold domain-containing protein [Planctomycetota bacterium]
MRPWLILPTVVSIALSASSAFGAGTTIETFTYKTSGEKHLEIHVHYPPDWTSGDSRPAMIFFFGGGWTGGSTDQFMDQAEYFASRGMVTARADYRVKSRDGVTPDQCVEDARSAVRWLRKNAQQLGIDPKKLVSSGGSAGGHLAACMMIEKSVEAEGDDLSISTVPQAMVLFNPVLSFESEQILGRLGDKKHLAKRISPTAHLRKGCPPALILFGTEDRLKVFGDSYWEKAEGLGVRAEKYIAEGQGHGFFNRSPWKERTMKVADEFLISLGLLEGPPTVKVPEEAAEERPRSREGSRQGPQRSRDLRARWLSMDTDGDEKISKEEARGQIKNNFAQIDTTGDGFIDRGELQALAQRLGQRRDGSASRRR